MMLKIDDEDMKLLQQGSIPEHLAMSEALLFTILFSL
jgi:hypothetical protein